MTGAEERSIKLGRLRGMMEARGLDGVFLKRQDNFAWLTGGGINYVGLGEMGKDPFFLVDNTMIKYLEGYIAWVSGKIPNC